MHLGGRTLLALGLLALLAPTTLSQVRFWRGAFDAALEEAERRNVPIVVLMVTDGEESSEFLVGEILKQPEVVKLFSKAVVILGCSEIHGTKSEIVDGRKMTVCEKYGSCTCEQHASYKLKAYRHFYGANKVMKTPAAKFCTPGLEVVVELEDDTSASSYVSAMKKVLAKVGPGLDPETWKAVEQALTRAYNLAKGERWAEAWAALDAAPSVAEGSLAARRVQERRDEIAAAVGVALEKASTAGLTHYVILLDEVAATFEDAAVGKAAAAKLRELRRDRGAREAFGRLEDHKKLVREADRARRYEERKKWRDARRIWRRVLERGSGLPVAAQAAERLKVYETEPEIREFFEKLDRERQGRELLDRARDLEREGKLEEARAIYDRVVREHAGTRAERSARRRLKELSDRG